MTPGILISETAALLAQRVAGKSVLVAMSGGVDSTVAAALLIKAGADVTGGTLKFWNCGLAGPGKSLPKSPGKNGTEFASGGEHQGRSCCCLDGVADARDACLDLGIPHYAVEVAADFEALVQGPSLAAYASGLTPNPCVLCNRHLKFGSLARFADGMGIDLIATGHYATIPYIGNRPYLSRGADPAKDQSYFLFSTPLEILEKLLFPLGNYTKPQVRKMARELGLNVSEKPDSQDLCFELATHGESNHTDHDTSAGRGKPGRLVDMSGKVLGTHQGVGAFTIGQRKGHGISHTEPLYVKSIDAESGDVVLATDDKLYSSILAATVETWFGVPETGEDSSGSAAGSATGAADGEIMPPPFDQGLATLPEGPFRAMVQIRYRAAAVPATVSFEVPASLTGAVPSFDANHGKGRIRGLAVNQGSPPIAARVTFDSPQRAITPGQAMVIYNLSNEIVLGGGWIKRPY